MTNGLDEMNVMVQNSTIAKQSGVNNMEPMIEYALTFAGFVGALVWSIKYHTDVIANRQKELFLKNPDEFFASLEN